MKMIIMQGLPGSGKSFHAKKLADKNTVIVSADSFPGLYQDGKFQVGLLKKAHAAAFCEAIHALQRGESVVVDNTNTTLEEVAPYIMLAMALGADPSILTIEVDPWKAKDRNTHNVPEATFTRLLAQLVSFRLPDYWANSVPREILRVE